MNWKSGYNENVTNFGKTQKHQQMLKRTQCRNWSILCRLNPCKMSKNPALPTYFPIASKSTELELMEITFSKCVEFKRKIEWQVYLFDKGKREIGELRKREGKELELDINKSRVGNFGFFKAGKETLFAVSPFFWVCNMLSSIARLGKFLFPVFQFFLFLY